MSALRFVSAASLIVALLWSSNVARGQTNSLTEPLAPCPFTKDQIENPPKREVKIEQLAEPHKIKFDRPYPWLAEQKFVVLVRLELPPPDTSNRSSLEYPDLLPRLEYLEDTKILTGVRSGSGVPLRTSFAGLLKGTPDDLVPKEAREYFQSPEVDRGFVTVQGINTERRAWYGQRQEPDVENGKPMLHIWMYGKTVEECEQRARALLTLLDYGFSRTIQSEQFKQRTNYAEGLTKHQATVRALNDELQTLKKSLQDYADLNNDMLTGLQLQQREAEIALAGVKARLAAADRLLAAADKEGATQRRRDQLLETKLAAELDSADWEARQAKAMELVGKVKTRVELTTKLATAERQLPGVQQAARHYRDSALRLDQELRRHAPLPVVDQKILIRPIEWSTP